MPPLTIQEGPYTASIIDLKAEVVSLRTLAEGGEEANRLVDLHYDGDRVISTPVSIWRANLTQGVEAFLRFESGQEIQYYFHENNPVRLGHVLIFRFLKVGSDQAENVRIGNVQMKRHVDFNKVRSLDSLGAGDAKVMSKKTALFISLIIGAIPSIFVARGVAEEGYKEGLVGPIILMTLIFGLVVFLLLLLLRKLLSTKSDPVTRKKFKQDVINAIHQPVGAYLQA